jgi:predicted metalloprotease
MVLVPALVIGLGALSRPLAAHAAPVAEPTPAPAGQPGLGPDGCPIGTFEGVYQHHQMREYYACSVRLIESFFYATYGAAWTPPADYVYVAYGDTYPHACRGDDADDTSYFYCPSDQTVYIGAQAMWDDYNSNMGDGAHFGSLAHEVGHHLQYLFVPFDDDEQLTEIIAAENQADCVMGAWVRYAHERGWLEWDDDIANFQALIAFLADTRPDGVRDHGNLEERTNSFNAGHEQGIDACNAIHQPIHGVAEGVWVEHPAG